ncbi:hypothetical protein Sjap_017860 [Stephania japonica]|uniref:Uncharacterized protein n=1 Tax=Stephania japonica TaxID=461633 RepID=A0AAP0I721_9MAGN
MTSQRHRTGMSAKTGQGREMPRPVAASAAAMGGVAYVPPLPCSPLCRRVGQPRVDRTRGHQSPSSVMKMREKQSLGFRASPSLLAGDVPAPPHSDVCHDWPGAGRATRPVAAPAAAMGRVAYVPPLPSSPLCCRWWGSPMGPHLLSLMMATGTPPPPPSLVPPRLHHSFGVLSPPFFIKKHKGR